jgi:hypothetical protein
MSVGHSVLPEVVLESVVALSVGKIGYQLSDLETDSDLKVMK